MLTASRVHRPLCLCQIAARCIRSEKIIPVFDISEYPFCKLVYVLLSDTTEVRPFDSVNGTVPRCPMIDILLSAGEARMRAQLTFLSPSRLLYKDLSRASRSEDLKFLKLRP